MQLHEKVRPAETALLVIDKQNDIFHEDGAFNRLLGLDASPIRAITDRLDQFIAEARKAGVLVCYSQMVNDRDLSPPNLIERLTQGSEKGAGDWPYALGKGTWGYEFYGEQPTGNDWTIDKFTFDFFSEPKLQPLLRRNRIRNIMVAGAYSHICVPTTATRGFTEGYHVVVPTDLVATTRQKIAYELADSQKIVDSW